MSNLPTYDFMVKKEGWMGKPNGLLQIIWERGFIDEHNLILYSLKGKKNQSDKDGKLKKEYCKYSLHTFMFVWGMMKRRFCSIPLKEKYTNKNLTSM